MRKPFRLYYWLEGTPEDRIGGPWWYLDFESEHERREYYHLQKSRYHDHEFEMADTQHTSLDIYPQYRS